MRAALSQLIENTIVYEYSLPNVEKGIERVHFSTNNDDCFSATNKESLVSIIYNSILDYSFQEFDLTQDTYKNLLSKALRTKFKFDTSDTQSAKIKYGFYGEVLLHTLLLKMYGTKCLICRGYFYNPLNNSETTGYDAYHIIENIDKQKIELWFGEVKFYINPKTAIDKIMRNIDKALSNEYLENNIIAMQDHKDKITNDKSKLRNIIDKWDENPDINIVNELKDNNMNLVYPIFIIFDMNNKSYDDCIKNVVSYIKDNYKTINASLSTDYKLFFIFMPIQNVKEVKEEVLKWIEEKKPVLL
ncbi:MAG: DUF1837 domain-containing protein [bacterium]|nr:DUF1837 domain-containing protein [bacterium]